jgi:hypothetical protein
VGVQVGDESGSTALPREDVPSWMFCHRIFARNAIDVPWRCRIPRPGVGEMVQWAAVLPR